VPGLALAPLPLAPSPSPSPRPPEVPPVRARPSLLALSAALLLSAGCSSSSTPAAGPAAQASSPAGAAPTAAASPAPLPVEHRTTWLCRPGMSRNPCEGGLGAEVRPVAGSTGTEEFTPAATPPVDCFYVYPTVSSADADNAPLRSSPEVVATARAQASRFAQACRLFVPVYRQATTRALTSGKFFDAKVQALADGDVRSAWHDYLNEDNDGRGVVLIGHSQGAMALERLIAAEVEQTPALSSRLVSALLLGGNVTTAPGQDTGGTFRTLPACREAGQTGCVVAYSTYAGTPPADGLFGRTSATLQGLCTDPTVLSGGKAGALDPYLPSDRLATAGGLSTSVPVGSVDAGFVAYPGSLRGRCRSTATFSWLDVSEKARARTPDLPETLGAAWGLHVGDVNLALGDLVETVEKQSDSWAAAH